MTSDEIGAFERFLEYGPIGIVGLTLVLAVFGLLAREIDENRYNLLRLVLFIGAFSLVALLLADFWSNDSEHELRVTVWPIDGAVESQEFPPPVAKVNEDPIDRSLPFIVARDVVLTIDVSEAFAALKTAQLQVEENSQRLDNVSNQIADLANRVSQASSSASNLEVLRFTRELDQSLGQISGRIHPIK